MVVDKDLKTKREQLKKEQLELKKKRSFFKNKNTSINNDKNYMPLENLDQDTVDYAKLYVSYLIDKTTSTISNENINITHEQKSKINIEDEIYNNGEPLTEEQIKKINEKLDKKYSVKSNTSLNNNYNTENNSYHGKNYYDLRRNKNPIFNVLKITFIGWVVLIVWKFISNNLNEIIIDTNMSENLTNVFNSTSESFFNGILPTVAIFIIMLIPLLIIFKSFNGNSFL